MDVNFNCNVVVGSDGVITGAQGGHPDTAAGAKCTIVIAPLLQGRIPAICSEVTTVTTPGESIDVVITDYGIAINPRRQDLIEAMKGVDLPFKTIEELRDIAYSIVGELVQKNVEKTNKKRAKKGLPPTKVGNVDDMLKKYEEKESREESARMAKIAKSKAQVEESNKYYNQDAKPGSLASKAGMVAKYNERQEKGNKK